MTIERLTISDGAPIYAPQSPSLLADRLLRERADQIQIIPAGVYDVTPKTKATPPVKDELTVLDNGTGILRVLPLNALARTTYIHPAQGITEGQGRQTIFQLPAEQTRMFILAPQQHRKKILGIFEIIRWRPEE